MKKTPAREEICATGLELLSGGLVARTWGNVSSRVDESSLLITPSGLDYTRTKPEDIVSYNFVTSEAQGIHKPSSEKGIHAAAYEIFPDVNFVVHTHQCFASAIGLAGLEDLDISDEERERLGGIALATYGLPGTKKLKNAVRTAMESGAKTVLMVSHGAAVCGKDKTDAMEMVRLLEDICRRNVKLPVKKPQRAGKDDIDAVMEKISAVYPYADLVSSDAAVEYANTKLPLQAQLDDMAQMLGASVLCVPFDAQQILKALKNKDAVFAQGMGAVVKADYADDAQALKMLVEKAAVSALHTKALGAKIKLSDFDTALMRFVYKNKYSKQKGK